MSLRNLCGNISKLVCVYWWYYVCIYLIADKICTLVRTSQHLHHRTHPQDEEGSSNQRKNRLAQIEARRDALQHRVLSTDEKHKHDVFTQNLWASAVEKFILQILGWVHTHTHTHAACMRSYGPSSLLFIVPMILKYLFECNISTFLVSVRANQIQPPLLFFTRLDSAI